MIKLVSLLRMSSQSLLPICNLKLRKIMTLTAILVLKDQLTQMTMFWSTVMVSFATEKQRQGIVHYMLVLVIDAHTTKNFV